MSAGAADVLARLGVAAGDVDAGVGCDVIVDSGSGGGDSPDAFPAARRVDGGFDAESIHLLF